ncbi:putative ABC transport system permease protein [Microbacterium sp. W4I4]|uniref:ABC transporter permease n=1 Tax=Microbacterium sp. W4I4 TaxID=3042295 RepID=UPI002781BDD7|nr:ABC transporter permease [Microbacterium sp. W4I4]MDQ0613297.1 putative ABC transport system permease protein [Microbacterium sp. W4I4]
MTAILGALADAWAEIRVHRMRVLLSLIGIAVSVGALTAVVALSEYQFQNQIEQSDRYGGRAATIQVYASAADGGPVDAAQFQERFDRVAERYGFTQVSRVADGLQVLVDAPDGARQTSARLLDPSFALIHREKLIEGREFLPTDVEALAPPVIISEPLWDRLGRVPVAQHPTLRLRGEAGGTYQIVGVRPKQWQHDEEVRIDLLFDAYAARVDRLPDETSVHWDVWVSEHSAAEIGPVLAMDLRAGLPAGQVVNVSRADFAAQPGYAEGMRIQELIMTGIAALILGLGALSLINIQLVAMRQRVREIGVRRAFGATAGRVFTTVLLESLVATTVAGIIGIALTVAALRWVMAGDLLNMQLQDVPPFPMRAAVTGLVAAVVVGALSGFVPALVALRVKVIDAIRF